MKNHILISLLLTTLCINANAAINNGYQQSLINHNDNATSNVQSITNDAISLNPAIDEINASDPRIKSVIDYVKTSGSGVSIMFFNPDNLRYVKKVNALFQANNIFTNPPQLAKTKNLVDFNLIKIYVLKENHNVNKPTKPAK